MSEGPLGFGEQVKDLYDSERKALGEIRRVMAARHSFQGVTTIDEEDRIKRAFAEEMRNRCAEIGLVVDVIWEWEHRYCPLCSLARDSEVTFGKGEHCPHCGGEGQRLTGSPDVSDDPDDNNLYWNPMVVVVGRTDSLAEYDHDRQQHEVRSGLLDGRAGVIREDGSFREDPKKKNIV